ncbi:MAG: hypothetical protein JO080_08670 [Mucilaginibacter sp.]|nr:hypothetical protein [Mucilaginibacter sp.]
MEKIVVVNDDSKEALQAAKYAFQLACFYNKDIVLANMISAERSMLNRVARSKAVPAGFEVVLSDDENRETVGDHLNCLRTGANFHPGIENLDASGFGEREMIAYINSHKICLIIHGIAADAENQNSGGRINMKSVLNRILWPVLLVPEFTPVKKIERIVYLADLRYAQTPVINYLAKWRVENESVIVAHLCTKGLSELDKTYAEHLFNNELIRRVVCKNLFFSNPCAKSFSDTMDEVIHGMEADMLVCLNHSYHFQQIFGSFAELKTPGYISVPVLVFPS